MTPKRQGGFTLVELIVAVTIFFIMSALLYAMLDGVRRQLGFAEEAGDSLRELHYAMRRIGMDLSQLQPRPVRNELGSGWKNAVETGDGTNTIEVSVGGWRNPMVQPRGSVQRVAYLLDGDVLTRLHWPVLDRTLALEPLRVDLLTGVRELRVRFLDANGEWSEQWPPFGAGSGPADTRLRPRAIELLIDHEYWGEIARIIEISG